MDVLEHWHQRTGCDGDACCGAGCGRAGNVRPIRRRAGGMDSNPKRGRTGPAAAPALSRERALVSDGLVRARAGGAAGRHFVFWLVPQPV